MTATREGTQRDFRMVTSDLEEAVAAVSRVYCPHELKVRGPEGTMSSTLEVVAGGVQPVVSLHYAAPVRIDAGNFENLLLVKTCRAGSASARQGAASLSFGRGQTIPLSPWAATLLDFDGSFVQRSVRLDVDRIETLCAGFLDRPLDAALRFELRPFSPALERAWADAVELVLAFERRGMPLPPASALRLDEFMLSLLLELHPHNHSQAMRAPHRLATPRALREAEHLMRTAPAGAGLTVGAIAQAVGCSIRSLEAAFREWRQTTPTRYYRRVRLEAARADLLRGDGTMTVGMVALQHGFPHIPRFAAHYRAAFGENPARTLQRARAKGR